MKKIKSTSNFNARKQFDRKTQTKYRKQGSQLNKNKMKNQFEEIVREYIKERIDKNYLLNIIIYFHVIKRNILHKIVVIV